MTGMPFWAGYCCHCVSVLLVWPTIATTWSSSISSLTAAGASVPSVEVSL